jgi:hypothetical protein
VIDIPAPDDLLKEGLLLVFGPGLIVTAFVIVSAVTSWLGFARTSFRTGRAIASGYRSVSRSVRATSRANVGVAIVVALFVLAAQATWVYLGYYTGNSVRIFVEGLNGTLKTPPAMEVRYIPQLLTSDEYSVTGMLINAAAAAYSWIKTVRGRSIEGFTVLLAAPGYVWAFFGLGGGALNSAALLLFSDYDSFTWPNVVYMFTFGIAGALYVLATQYVLGGPSWSRSVGSANVLN